jgi:hypothetical protein
MILAFGGGMALAQNGYIGIFADPVGYNDNLPGTPGLANYYFVHVNAVGATASQWAAPAPTCVTAVRLADLPVFSVNLGNTSAGITIGYGTCNTRTFHIITTLYQLIAAADCCFWSVVAEPNLPSGKIQIPDCGFGMSYRTGGHGVIKRTSACPYVPTERTTSGQVKALYTE